MRPCRPPAVFLRFTATSAQVGPGVRIRLAPPASLQTVGPSRDVGRSRAHRPHGPWQRELLRLATNHDRRGDHLDCRAYLVAPPPAIRGRWGNLALRAAGWCPQLDAGGGAAYQIGRHIPAHRVLPAQLRSTSDSTAMRAASGVPPRNPYDRYMVGEEPVAGLSPATTRRRKRSVDFRRPLSPATQRPAPPCCGAAFWRIRPDVG
jgi:hypothetical protein